MPQNYIKILKMGENADKKTKFVLIFMNFVMIPKTKAATSKHVNLLLSMSERLLSTTSNSTRNAKRLSLKKLYRVLLVSGKKIFTLFDFPVFIGVSK